MRTLSLTMFLLVTLGFAASLGSHALAQDAPPAGDSTDDAAAAEDEEAPPPPTRRDIPEIVPKLRSQDVDEALVAVDQLTVINHRDVIAPIAEALRDGLNDRVTDRCLEALRTLKNESAIEVLTEFTRHRRVEARRKAYAALAAIESDAVPPLLQQGLRDSDRTVRGNAARLLGEIGATDAVDILFVAFERGVVEAAPAIGKLGDEAAVTRFDVYLGQQPLAVMLSGYREFIVRDDISIEVKTDMISRLGEVSGPMVRQFVRRHLRTELEGQDNEYVRHVREVLSRIPRTVSPSQAAPAPAPAPAPEAGQ